MTLSLILKIWLNVLLLLNLRVRLCPNADFQKERPFPFFYSQNHLNHLLLLYFIVFLYVAQAGFELTIYPVSIKGMCHHAQFT